MNRMLTYTGLEVDIQNPALESICIEDIAHSLSQQCRFTGHTSEFYSVAEHCVLLSERSSYPKWALMHDAAEAYISDIATPVKHLPKVHNVIRPLENKILAVIAEKFDLPWPMPEEVHQLDKLLGDSEFYSLMHKDNASDFHPPLWTPREARTMFLIEYERLFNART